MNFADFKIDYKGTVSHSLGSIPAQDRSQCEEVCQFAKSWWLFLCTPLVSSTS